MQARAIGFVALLSLATVGSVFAAPCARADTQSCVEASERAQALRDEGKLRAARAALVTCTDETCPPIIQKDCSQWLEEVEHRMPSVVFSVRDSAGNDVGAVRVLIDGSPLVDRLDGKSVTVDPGEHTFRFEHELGPPIEQRAIVRENDKGRLIAIVLPKSGAHAASPSSPNSPPQRATGHRSIPTASYVLGGVSLAGAAGFAYFWLSAVGDAKDLQATCDTRGCNEQDLSAARTKALVADVLIGVSAAAAIGAATFYFLQRPSDRAVSVRVSPSKESLVMSLGRSF